jgi:tetratricopeptide (TPR) repeat protein
MKISGSELISATSESGPAGLEALQEHLAVHSEDVDSRFAMANYFARQGDLDAALREYELVLAALPTHKGARFNRGVVLRALGKEQEATQLFQALLEEDTNFALPHLHLGRSAFARGDYSGARHHLEQLIERQIHTAEAAFLLGKTMLAGKMNDSARRWFALLLDQEPSHREAKVELTKLVFSEGAEKLRNGKLSQALRFWGETGRKYQLVFSADEEILRQQRELIDEFKKARGVPAALREYRTALREGRLTTQHSYQLFSAFTFSVGLQPEAWEDPNTLETAAIRWRTSLAREGEHPYPHFRLGLIAAYSGELDTALTELTVCRDRTPPKRHAMLKLNELIQFIKSVLDIRDRRQIQIDPGQQRDEWARLGFTSEIEIKGWQRLGVFPDEAAAWRDVQISAKRAASWRKAGIDPKQAATWTENGFQSPKEALRLARSGFDPDEAKRWRAVFAGASDRAVQAKTAGFTDPLVAIDWLERFYFPWEAFSWFANGFAPDEALDWKAVGFTNAELADRLRKEGLTPEQAAERLRGSLSSSPEIPPDELD